MTACGLTNLGTCLPEKFFEFIADMLNAPIEPILQIVQSLMTEPVNIQIFSPLWAVIVYVISIFYGLFFLFAGVNFMISGYDSAKRENAKAWVRNTVLMILFIQSSFLIYEIMVELASLMTTGVMNIIDPNFFLLTITQLPDLGMHLIFLVFYVFSLGLSALFLTFRYVLVSVGIVFFPIGLFLYFIPPLRAYGKLVMNVLVVVIFVPFFCAIVLFGTSALLSVPVFSATKIILMTTAFMMINQFMLLLVVFAILKAAFSVLNSDVGRNVKRAAALFI